MPASGLAPVVVIGIGLAQALNVTTLVEIATPQGPFGLPHVLRDADIREVGDLTAELRRVKREPAASASGKWLRSVRDFARKEWPPAGAVWLMS